MNWSVAQLTEVRGIDRIVCVVTADLAERAAKLLSKEEIDIVVLPKQLLDAKDAVIDKWLTAADGPAYDADTVAVSTASSPFLQASTIEACVRAVNRGKCTTCQPARDTSVVNSTRKVKALEAVESVRVFKVNVPAEGVRLSTVPVSMIQSLDINQPDEFVMADALVAADKI
jgi:2-C-methyl-D-erythritol 4-phosphate cytidylyltransferase